MIDAGAYIGDTAVLFLSSYPNLKIIALEPNTDSFNLAAHNLEPYGDRITLLKKALWTSETELRFGGMSTSASIQENGSEVKCTSLPAIIQEYSIPRVDILKMDIEGAEEEVFAAHANDWLPAVDLIIVEIHGDSRFRVISDVLRDSGFTMIQYRSVWYCFRCNKDKK